MWDQFFSVLDVFDNFLWSYIGFPAIIFVGLWLSIRSKFVQLRKLPEICGLFFHFLFHRQPKSSEPGVKQGVHPIMAFFAGLGGCVGIGNVVAIATALQIGGPGAVFWMWMTAVVGSLVKYSEVFLGIRYRVRDAVQGFRGGPMFFLKKALGPGSATLFCILMCVYGVEVFQFSVVTHSISSNFEINNIVVTLVLLALVIFAELGGITRIARISAIVIPVFIVMYLAMGTYILYQHASSLIDMIVAIFTHAFTMHAAIGSFVGTTILMTISQGIRRGCYSSDIGVGYSSIIYSESRVKNPARQASLVIFEVFFDTFVICTMSMFLVLITDTWQESVGATSLVQIALSKHFPYMDVFMPFFLFLLGYSTIITYFCAGIRTAEYVAPKWGRFVYYAYAIVVLSIFSFVETAQALIVMSIVQVLLLALNLTAVMRLRREINFDFSVDGELAPVNAMTTQPAQAI